jgi:hypothetical protein
MADKPTSTLNNTVVTAVVTALSASLTAAKNSGLTLLDFCKAAAKAKLPKTLPEPDVVAIVDALSAKMGWAGTPREKVSKSEARNLIRQHAYLPELMDALRASEYGQCGYHDAVKLCRLMKSEGNVAAAVAKFNTKAEPVQADTFAGMVSAIQKRYQFILEQKRTKEVKAEMAVLNKLASDLKFEIVKDADKLAA